MWLLWYEYVDSSGKEFMGVYELETEALKIRDFLINYGDSGKLYTVTYVEKRGDF